MTSAGRARTGSGTVWSGVFAFASVLLLTGCQTAEPTRAVGPDMARETGCNGDKPLAERLAEITPYLEKAFASAPPFSQAEYDQMRHLGACTGASVLGVGSGCEAEWAEATASGLAERSRIRGAQISIPKYFQMAEAAPVRSQRIRNLTTAHAIAWQAHEYNEIRFATGKIDDDARSNTSIALFTVEGLIQDAIACEALR